LRHEQPTAIAPGHVDQRAAELGLGNPLDLESVGQLVAIEQVFFFAQGELAPRGVGVIFGDDLGGFP
jgi:hypothetical protein